MNKILTIALIAGGLLLLESPEAAAHKEIRNVYPPSFHYRVESRRAKHMPHWLHHKKSFRRWYRNSRLRHNRRLSWNRLFDIYRWERYQAKVHRRSHRHRDWYADDYGYKRHRNWYDDDYGNKRHRDSGDERRRGRNGEGKHGGGRGH